VESKKLAKAGRSKARDADAEYNLAKLVEKQMCEAHDMAISNADSVHREHRLLLKQELGRMVLFFTDQPTLLAPNLQMVFATLAMVRSEILWYFCHVGIMVGKSKGTRVIPIEMDIADPTIGFLLDGMDRLIRLVSKYTPGWCCVETQYTDVCILICQKHWADCYGYKTLNPTPTAEADQVSE
jgi:NCK-associated protein 1